MKTVVILVGLLLIYSGLYSIKTKAAVIGKAGSMKLTGSSAVAVGVTLLVLGLAVIFLAAVYHF